MSTTTGHAVLADSTFIATTAVDQRGPLTLAAPYSELSMRIHTAALHALFHCICGEPQLVVFSLRTHEICEKEVFCIFMLAHVFPCRSDKLVDELLHSVTGH